MSRGSALFGTGRWLARRRRVSALIGSTAVVVGLLVAFAIELSDAQASSKAGIEARVHEGAVLSAALVDSLFGTVTQQVPLNERTFGGRVVSRALLDRSRGSSAYLALFGPGGRLLVSSTGFTAQARAGVAQSGVLRLTSAGDRYALGNLVPYGRSGAIDLGLALPGVHGRRVLVEGFSPMLLATFLGGELSRIPGVSGARNLIVDANDAVIASNTSSQPVGYRFKSAAARAALGRSSGQRHGRYYEQVRLADSTWRIVLSAPSGVLFASVTGFDHWLPWLIFIAFALVAAVAIALGWRVHGLAERDLALANHQLAQANRALADANAALERRAEELARSNAELDQFASIASHDLQEPLRKVRTFTQQVVATESAQLSERGADYLGRANQAAARMQGLIEDLLQFSRVSQRVRPPVAVDLDAVVHEVLDDLSVELQEAGAHVSVSGLTTIVADPLQMRQLILNLLSNALKFRRAGVTPEVAVRGSVGDGMARIEVADNGIGFEQQYGTRIFRVFERLNGRGEYPGTGIGLALCQKIVERHGGAIYAEGQLGVGAKFTVTLPVERASSEQPDTGEDEYDYAKEQAHAH